MKNLFIGFLSALLIVALSLVGYEAYQIRKLSRSTATYLFAETEVKSKDGKSLSRADLFDALLRDAVSKASQAPVQQTK